MQFLILKVNVEGSSTALIVSTIYNYFRTVSDSGFPKVPISDLEMDTFKMQCLMDPTIRPLTQVVCIVLSCLHFAFKILTFCYF